MLATANKETVASALTKAKQALHSNSMGEINDCLTELQNVGRLLTEVMLFDPSSFRTGSGSGGGGESSGKPEVETK